MRIAFALTAVLGIVAVAPTLATASGCYLGPFAASADVPLGCSVYSWQQAQFEEPRVSVKRDGRFVELAATVETETVALDVFYVQTDCDDVEHWTPQKEPYEHARITFDDALVGDELWIEGLPIGTIVANGACPADVTPSPVCGSALPNCEDDPRTNDPLGTNQEAGCNAGGGGGGLAIGLFAIVFGLRLRRRRTSEHTSGNSCACSSP